MIEFTLGVIVVFSALCIAEMGMRFGENLSRILCERKRRGKR